MLVVWTKSRVNTITHVYAAIVGLLNTMCELLENKVHHRVAARTETHGGQIKEYGEGDTIKKLLYRFNLLLFSISKG